MRKCISLLAVALLCVTALKAQYVNIPDAGFRSFLQNQFPACFNSAGQLDTTCSEIVNATSLSTLPNASNLDGLQYFKSLITLDIGGGLSTDTIIIPSFAATLQNIYLSHCNVLRDLPPFPQGLKVFKGVYSTGIRTLPAFPEGMEVLMIRGSVQLTNIPQLPSTLRYLDCSELRNVVELPSLPYGLRTLWCENGSFTFLPLLPETLDSLNCTNNRIASLSPLPAALTFLNCSFNTLTSLPALPPGIQTINCSANSMSAVPDLPIGLKELSCGGMSTAIFNLPALPESLVSLVCPGNTMVSLPELPASIKFLFCNNSNLNTLPALPDSIETLVCNNNNLNAIPQLPQKLKTLVCYSNPLSQLPILPASLTYLDCSQASLTTLPLLPTRLETLNCNNNELTGLPPLPDSLRYMNCYQNNILCLPVLPDIFIPEFEPIPRSRPQIMLDADKINCHPNITTHTILSEGGRLLNLPLCNPLNNRNHCPSFPVMQGSVFYDANNNGIKDANELTRKNVRVILSNGSFGFTNNSGNYEIGADSIGNYALTAEPPRYFNCVPASRSYVFTSYDTLVMKDFALQANTTIDELTIHITPINWAARPGFAFPYQVNFENTGTTTLTPTILFDYDETRLNYNTSSVAGIADDTHQLTYNAGTLRPGESAVFTSYFTLKPTVPLGDLLWAKASIHASSFTAYDSTLTIVRGAFDPNDKQATPQLSPAQVANGEYIDYTIRFQNTGTDTAFNVVISDTLSSMLQANTLQMIAASHNCKTTVKDNVVFFEFLNILLPDSNVNEPKSHGFVSFKIKPQTNVSVNSSINNKAAIYFDYNAPVITNTASTLIKEFITVPLKLVSFSAVPQSDNTTTLCWNTANEINSNYFVIESGTDGFHFNSVATIAANGMANNAYNASVADNNTGIVFFRLKMVDKDGRFTYSPIIKTDRRKNTSGISILSNPVKDMLIISSSDALLNNSTALIINSNGAVVKSFVVKEGAQMINIKSLPAGLYYIKTMNGSNRILVL